MLRVDEDEFVAGGLGNARNVGGASKAHGHAERNAAGFERLLDGIGEPGGVGLGHLIASFEIVCGCVAKNARPEHWPRTLAQNIGPEHWPRTLAQNVGPSTLAQNAGPRTWPKNMAQRWPSDGPAMTKNNAPRTRRWGPSRGLTRFRVARSAPFVAT